MTDLWYLSGWTCIWVSGREENSSIEGIYGKDKISDFQGKEQLLS